MAGRLTGWARAPVIAVLAGIALLGAAACGGDGAQEAADGPVAAVQDDYLSHAAPIEDLPARVAMVAETGATVTRVDIFWSTIAPERPANPRDPDDPAYDWARPDLIMNELAEADIQSIVSVYSTPAWAVDGDNLPHPAPYNPNTPRAGELAAFMHAVAARYRGDFTPRGGERPLPAVGHFEIWNEPNLGGFLVPQIDPESGERVSIPNYAAMVRAAYPAIKRANPDAVVIAGVAGPRGSSSETGTGALDWLRGLRELGIPLDAYSQHIYPASPPLAETEVVPAWATIDVLLEELDGFAPGLPLYITEAGYTTAATPFRDTKVTEEQQAEYLVDIYSLPQLKTPRVPTVVWFNLQDNANWPAGLLREDQSRKPSYERFRAVVAAQEGARLAR
jgi:hypothetical protein